MSGIPAMVDALLAVARALETVQVLDGFQVTADPGNYLMVGVDDPNTLLPSAGASDDMDWRYIGHNTVTDEGFVRCCALSWVGDPDALKAMRDAAFGIYQQVYTAIKTDPTLATWYGSPACQFCGMSHADYIPTISVRGSEVLVPFTVRYKSLI